MIAADPDHFLNRHLAGQIKVEGALDPRVVAEYRRCYRDPATRHAICEDYRAAASIDLDHDAADGERRIEAPLLLLWGENGTVGTLFDVMESWRLKARDVRGRALPCGHSRSEEHTSELQSLMRISYAVFCLKKKNKRIGQEHMTVKNESH